MAGSSPEKSSNGDFGGESQLGRYSAALAGAQESLNTLAVAPGEGCDLWAKSMCEGEGERDELLLLLVSVMTCRRRDLFRIGEHEELDDGVDGLITTRDRGGERDDDNEERKRLRDRDRDRASRERERERGRLRDRDRDWAPREREREGPSFRSTEFFLGTVSLLLMPASSCFAVCFCVALFLFFISDINFFCIALMANDRLIGLNCLHEWPVQLA